MPEFIDIYNAQKERIAGGHERWTAMQAGNYRFVVRVMLYNSRGEILLQKRVADKRTWPSYWDFSAAGAVDEGESLAQGIHRELLEELGIDIDFTEIPSRMTLSFPEGWDESWFVPWDGDLSELTIQTSEVEEVRWFNEKDYLDLLERGEFIPYIYGRALFDLIRESDDYLTKRNDQI